MSVFDVIIFIHVIAVIVGFVTIILLYIQKPSLYQNVLVATAICSFIGLLSYLLELLAKNLEEALLAARFGYVGKSYAMVLFLVFIAKYCDVYISKSAIVGLLLFSTTILFAVMSTPYHNLYYTSVDFVKGEYFSHLVLGKGVIYYIFMAVTLLVMLAFITISFSTLIRRKGQERRRLMLLCLSVVLPAIGLVLNLCPFLAGFDPTPLGIFLSTLLVSLNVLKYGLLDTMQLASENVMDNTEGGLVVVSKAKKFIYANQKAFQIFPELKDDTQSKGLLDELFSGIDSNNTERKTYNKNNIIYELNYSVLQENSNKNGTGINGYMAWIFDKTKDYNYTRELERLRLEAEEANKAKSFFLAKMSHEIRTPMNGIMGFADLALENNLDRESREYVSYIKDSADSLLDIINDVLDISKIESGKMQIIDVEYNPQEFFKDISAIISAQAEAKNLFFSTYITDELPRCLFGDKTRFREVLINVLGNAVKYTKRGGIIFKVNIVKRAEEHLVLEIHVVDSGVGIKQENLENIFDTFEQADTTGNYHVEGTGLGLSIARQLTELMGGRLTVKSTYGKGSDFCITIPQKYVAYSSDTSEQSDESELDIIANNIKALVVDDNIINLKVEKGLLERYNMQVFVAESGKACLDMAAEEKYDIIFMDHMMPDMDGVETLHQLKGGMGLNASTPVILVTANAIVGVEKEMRKEGFDGFVSKPIDIKILEKELLKLLPDDKLHITVHEAEAGASSDASTNNFLDKKTFGKTLAEGGIDIDVGLKYCGDLESYMSVLEIAISGSQEKFRKIKEYRDYQDLENYTIVVHSLKSGAANIGANSLSEKARMLEIAGRNKDFNTIKRDTDSLLEEYEKVIATIKECLQFSEESDSEHDSEKTLDGTMWREYLDKIEILLDELETDSVEIILEDLQDYNLTLETSKLLESMREYLSQFDVEGAKAVLNSLHSIDVE